MKILPSVRTWMAFEHIMLNAIIQRAKDKYHMTSFICRILKRKKKKNHLIDRRVVAEAKAGEWMKWMKVSQKVPIPSYKIKVLGGNVQDGDYSYHTVLPI